MSHNISQGTTATKSYQPPSVKCLGSMAKMTQVTGEKSSNDAFYFNGIQVGAPQGHSHNVCAIEDPSGTGFLGDPKCQTYIPH